MIRSNGRSSRRSPPRRGTTVRLLGAYGKSVPPQMQRILARIETCCGGAVWCARPLYNSNLACAVKRTWGGILQVTENTENKDLSFANGERALRWGRAAPLPWNALGQALCGGWNGTGSFGPAA